MTSLDTKINPTSATHRQPTSLNPGPNPPKIHEYRPGLQKPRLPPARYPFRYNLRNLRDQRTGRKTRLQLSSRRAHPPTPIGSLRKTPGPLLQPASLRKSPRINNVRRPLRLPVPVARTSRQRPGNNYELINQLLQRITIQTARKTDRIKRGKYQNLSGRQGRTVSYDGAQLRAEVVM